MVQLTRLDCAISSVGTMRTALAQAVYHCRPRSVFQKRLIDQRMMRSVLADMALQVEGATAAVMRLCRSFRSRRVVTAGGRAGPSADACDQILDLQERAGAGLRGDGV